MPSIFTEIMGIELSSHAWVACTLADEWSPQLIAVLFTELIDGVTRFYTPIHSHLELHVKKTYYESGTGISTLKISYNDLQLESV